MKLVLQIALGIIAVPFVIAAIVLALVLTATHPYEILFLIGIVIAGIAVQRKVFDPKIAKAQVWTDKGELRP